MTTNVSMSRALTLELLLALLEIACVGRLLVFARRHQIAIGADEIILPADEHVAIAFRADEFAPLRLGVWILDVAACHGPGPRQGMIVDGDLVAHDVLVVLVEVDALLEYR